jgi:type IV pilus assembly protein PilY1
MHIRDHTLFQFPLAVSSLLQSISMRLRNVAHTWSWSKTVLLLALPVMAIVSLIALGQSSPPSIPPITLSADPLYAPSAADKPALALALSVEFPTVGAQYVDPDNNNNSTTDDVTYSPTIEYLGYYDAESCYTYDNAGTGAPSGQTSAYKRFVRAGKAIPVSAAPSGFPTNTAEKTWTSRMCSRGSKSYKDYREDGTDIGTTTANDAFSGNFLNWASSSAIDMLRLSLTGGDRVIDTTTLTVLQRAIIPAGDPINMWNSSNFPSKRLYRSGTSRAITSTNFASASFTTGELYFGAVPSAMVTAAGTNDIYVANRLNQIYFGTAKSSTVSDYTLGGAAAAIQKGTSSTSSASLPSDAVLLGNEGATYTFSGTKEIWFGKNDATTTTWTVLPAYGGIDCYWHGSTSAPYGGINDPRSGVAKQCYSRPYTGSWTPTNTASALNSDGYFFSRVQVCDRDTSTYALKDVRYWKICSQYSDAATTPHPSFKPEGAIQHYADRLRLSAFGYLMDQNTSRYGGVLRAAMKYVGVKTFDINGFDNTPSGGNPNQEWNNVTGVFNSNPDNNTTVLTTDGRSAYLSGVVNYVNQFGRTGSVAGRYKKYDPIGELHYQALRYLQGLPPSSNAISGITTEMYDGFPVSTDSDTGWTDPYGNGRSNTGDYSCLKSNIVMIGDINSWDYNSRLPTASSTNNIPDISYWQGIAGKFESKTSGTYLDGANVSRSTVLSPNPNSANTSSLTSASGDTSIVGSAYWAHTHDIRGTTWTNATAAGTVGTTLQRPGLRVKTFTFDVNEYGGSNSATTRRSSNQLFRSAKYGGFESDPSNTEKNPYNTYGNPFFNEQNNSFNNYVWQDTNTRTSRVGEANTYYLQSDARGVLSAFDEIFQRASTAARSIAGGAIQSKNLTQAGSTIYQGTFDTSDWSGDLLAIPVNVSSGNVVSIGDNSTWTAATRLAALTAPATSRNIVVGNAGATANPVAAAFTWATVETGLQTSLNKISPTATEDGLGEDRLNYLRGDRTKEGNPFRPRSKLMGDVINSGVIYSGVPSNTINDSGYGSFYTANKDRTSAVFVGANDGMLHAFNGATGDELFAYIPSWLGPKLSALTSTTYLNNHQSYLDGTPAVAEALVGSNWKTVLVSGTGGGGKGVFALDVTNPATFSAADVMWEFTNADDADLGYVTGRPQILKLRTSATGSTYKWYAVFGGGVNNYVTDSGVFSSTGNPTLFILDLSKAAGTAWALGTNYYKITLPVNSTLSASKPTGLLNFRAALGVAKEVAYIFMGDLHGNLWKLDFTAAGTANWNISDLSYYKQGTTDNPIPMFIAKDASGNEQPISAAPSVAFGPPSVAGSFYVLFGTGKYLEVSDRASTTIQSIYMLYDNGSTTLDSSPASSATSAISDRRRLKLGTANATTGVITVPAFTPGRATTNTDTDNPRSGWVSNLPNSGERQVSNGTIFGDKVIFGSLIPSTSSTTACSATGGGGNVYSVDIQIGNATSVGSTVGILGEPLVQEISPATTYTHSNSTGRRTKTMTRQVFQQGSNGIAPGSTASQTVTTGRMSWRQINNYQDLKE